MDIPTNVEELRGTSLAQSDEATKPWIRRAAPWVLGLSAVTGIGAAGVAASEGYASDIIDRIDEIEVPIDVAVDPELPGTMIDLNEGLRDNATPYLLGAGAVGILAFGYVSSTEKGRALNGINKSNSHGRASRLILPALLMASVGSGSSLAQDSAEGAVRPLEMVEDSVAASGISISEDYTTFTQHESQVINNHGGIPKQQVEMLQDRFGEEAIIPVNVALGSIRPLDGGAEPPSAAIVTAPESAIGAIGNLDSISQTGLPTVIVGGQLDVKPGAVVVVDGKEFEVSDVIEAEAGIGRVVVYGTNDAMSEIFPEETYSFSLVHEDVQEEASTLLEDENVLFTTKELSELYDQYQEFFLGTISSSQMDFILKLGLVSGAGVLYFAHDRSKKNKFRDATLFHQAYASGDLVKATAYSTYLDSLKAAAASTVLIAGMKAMTGTAQYGFDLELSPTDVGAGLLVGQAVMLLGFAAEARQTKKNLNVDNLKVQV